MNSPSPNTLGVALTRVALGIVMIVHSAWLKLVIFTLPGTAAFFASLGLPGWFAYLVFAIETVAGVMLVLGWQTRLAAISVVPILLGATWAHWSAGWLFTNSGGGWEYPALLAVYASAQALLGSGAYALESRDFVTAMTDDGHDGPADIAA